ncbi:MAG: hypothetical protein FJ115_02250 [Deltaproteobacteria bacterium]|nr:hypothetical protein [Deltaproteobacteria bacterium]
MLDLFLQGGFLMYPILLGSMVGVAILIDKLIQYRKILRELDILPDDLLKKRATPSVFAPILEGLKITAMKRKCRSLAPSRSGGSKRD